MSAHVYVLEGGGLTKVGISTAPLARRSAVGTKERVDARILYITASTPCAREIEKRAHALLQGARVRGEWFAVTPLEARHAIEEAAQEAGVACDWVELPCKKGGGPIKERALGASATVGASIPSRLRAKLDALAKANRWSLSDEIRAALERHAGRARK